MSLCDRIFFCSSLRGFQLGRCAIIGASGRTEISTGAGVRLVRTNIHIFHIPVRRREHGRELVAAVGADQGGISVGAVAHLQVVVATIFAWLDVEVVAKIQSQQMARFGCNHN